MYKPVETHPSVPGWTTPPLLTLADKHGGVVHIVQDDGCYLCLLLQPDGCYRPTPWIFPELHAALAGLPLFGKMQSKPFDEIAKFTSQVSSYAKRVNTEIERTSNESS